MQRLQEINSRNDYIKKLNEFISTAKTRLGETFQKLNWKESATVVKGTVKPMVTCPLDPGHRLTCDNLEKHVEMCRWHRLDYRDDDVPFPPPPANLPISSVVIDKTLQRDIILKAARKDPSIKIGENVNNREVPQTSDRFFSDFTTDERRILYDHVVYETAGVMPQLKEFNLTMKPEGQSAPMTREQLMAAERDAKRRRVKHRTAKVHTKSKNYSEVLKEVINNQMLAYEDWIKEHFENENLQDAIEPDKKTIEEVKQEKQEMVWLDWDFRSNPHTRWKYILEKEKRRKERGENDDKRSGNDRSKEVEKNYNERKRDRDESSSRRYRHREEFRKKENGDKLKRDNHHNNQPKYNHEASYSGGRGNESSRRESHHTKHRKDKHEEKRLRTECKRDRYGSDHKSKYKDKEESKYREKNDLKYDQIEKGSERRVECYKDESNDTSTRKWDRYDGFHELNQDVRIKEEKLVDTQNQSYSHSSKSFESVPLKKEEDEESPESDSASDPSQSSSSRKVKKRKKSKKKHKHKHKKKHRKEHSQER